MYSIDSPAAMRFMFSSRLKLSFAIGLLTCFLSSTSSHSDPADGQWLEQYGTVQTSKRQEKPAAETNLSGPLFAVVSIADQRISFYGRDGLAARAPISSGMRGHPTPTGVFSIVQKKRFHQSNIYSGAPMPFMQRITWSGIAMHSGALPGYPASHGCIRLPSSFAQRIFGATEVGERVMIAPRDTTPVEITHKTLPTPLMQAAPGTAEASNAGAGTVTASIDTPQPQTDAPPEKASIADAPSAGRLLNPIEVAQAMKRHANEKTAAAVRATKVAMMLNATRLTELRIATRKLALAENALDNAHDKLTAASRRLERAEIEAAQTKSADAKAIESGAAELKAAEARAEEAKAAEAKAAEAKLAAAKAAEDAAANVKAAEAKLAEAKAADEAKAAEARTAAMVAETQAAASAAKPAGDAIAVAEVKLVEAKPDEIKQSEIKLNDGSAAEAASALEAKQKAAKDARKAAERADDAADDAQKAASKARRLASEVRDDAEKAQKAAETHATRQQDAIVKATEAKAAATAAIGDAQKAIEEGRTTKDIKQREADAARSTAEEAKVAGRTAAQVLAEANRRLKPLSVLISRKTGRLYVRQDFQPIFDAPITISNPERPIGTHLFVSTGATAKDTQLKWLAVTMPFLEAEAKAAPRERKRDRSGGDEAAAQTPAPMAATEPETPAGALDRIAIPEETFRRLAELAWVGAAIIVSDNGISGETGETTDFIILTRSRATAP